MIIVDWYLTMDSALGIREKLAIRDVRFSLPTGYTAALDRFRALQKIVRRSSIIKGLIGKTRNFPNR